MIENKLCEYLLDRRLKIATAESCTGGMVAMRITSVSGSSGCFDCGAVTYSNEKKTEMLGVSPETLLRHGAVSEETALEMCRGIKERANADIGIGITGIAGPTGGTPEKPVGLVYIGICTNKQHKAVGFVFKGDRQSVRESAAEKALNMAFEAAQEL